MLRVPLVARERQLRRRPFPGVLGALHLFVTWKQPPLKLWERLPASQIDDKL